MAHLLTGNTILDAQLLDNADANNLKNSTYDLTIGQIFPLGSEAKAARSPEVYYLAPSHMVLVVSKEAFKLPGTVTGLATLRTAFTKKGILALNVGVIDPHYNGPISAGLINFSDRTCPLHVGEKFFRVVFLEHQDVGEWKPGKDESLSLEQYQQQLEYDAQSLFPQTYLNIPVADKDFLYRNFWRSVRFGLTNGFMKVVSLFGALVMCTLIYYALFETGYGDFLLKIWRIILELLPV